MSDVIVPNQGVNVALGSQAHSVRMRINGEDVDVRLTGTVSGRYQGYSGSRQFDVSEISYVHNGTEHRVSNDLLQLNPLAINANGRLEFSNSVLPDTDNNSMAYTNQNNLTASMTVLHNRGIRAGRASRVQGAALEADHDASVGDVDHSLLAGVRLDAQLSGSSPTGSFVIPGINEDSFRPDAGAGTGPAKGGRLV
jgi:hypothetical protein